jgi:hypothetical protein
LGQAAKKRFAKSGQMLSGGDAGSDGLASIFISDRDGAVDRDACQWEEITEDPDESVLTMGGVRLV